MRGRPVARALICNTHQPSPSRADEKAGPNMSPRRTLVPTPPTEPATPTGTTPLFTTPLFTTPIFTMPIIRADVFNGGDASEIHDMLAKRASSIHHPPIDAVRRDFYVPIDRDIIEQAQTCFYHVGLGAGAHCLEMIPHGALAGRARAHAMRASFALDDIRMNTLNPMPLQIWDQNSTEMIHLTGRYGTLFHLARKISLYIQEYPSTYIYAIAKATGVKPETVFADARLSVGRRSLLGALILPPAQSAHEKLSQKVDVEAIWPFVQAIFASMLDGYEMELAEPDIHSAVEC